MTLNHYAIIPHADASHRTGPVQHRGALLGLEVVDHSVRLGA
jgi:hypothetical protein